MKTLTRYALTCLLAAVIVGCNKPTDTSTTQATSATKVSLRLQWFHLAQFAGFYVAQDKGLYRDAGLDVDIRPGGPDLNAITLVSSKSDDFGVWTADHILIAQSKGVPVIILAAVYRDDPNVLMVKEDSPIQTPSDFVGKTVTTVYGRSTETVLNALLQKSGVDKSKVNIVPFPFNLQSFFEGKVDVSAGYVYDHPYQAEKAGYKVRLISPAASGIKFYSDCVFARKDFVESNKEKVQAFVSATLKGWQLALQDHSLAVASTLKRGEGLDSASQTYMLDHAEPLIRAEDPDHIGRVGAASIEAMTKTLKAQGLLPDTFTPNASYDNEFVDAFYIK